MTEHHDIDVLDVLTRYAPTATTIEREWSTERSNSVLTAILGDVDPPATRTSYEIPIQFAPRRRADRRGRRLSVAASVAVLAVAAGAVVSVLASRDSRDAASPPGVAFDPPAGLSNATLADDQYSHRVTKSFGIDAEGRPVREVDSMTDSSWVSTNGDIRSVRTESQNGCFTFPRTGPADFESPTKAFFAALPTGVDELNTYLRGHVAGSSSLDEAVFVAVGDALTTADGLASPRLRAAFVAVLSRTPGVYVHVDQHDYLGRPAIRADFVNQAIRPDEVQSLYFDPTTFQLLEQRDGGNGQPTTYAGPSPAYSAPAGAGVDPDDLGGKAGVLLMTSETVVDSLPSLSQPCTSR